MSVTAAAWAKPTNVLTLAEARAVLDDMRQRVESLKSVAQSRAIEIEQLRASQCELRGDVAHARGALSHAHGEINRLKYKLKRV